MSYIIKKIVTVSAFILLISICLASCSSGKQALTEEEKNALTYSEVADILDEYIDKSGKGYTRGSHEYWNYVAGLITDDAGEEIKDDKDYSQYVEEFIDFSWATRMLFEKTGLFKIDKKTKLPEELQDKTMKELRKEYGAVGKKLVEGMKE